MAGVTDILVNIKGRDEVSGVLGKIKNSSAGLKTAMGTMMTGAGLALASYGKSAVESAIQAESAWNRFGANINSQGGNWNAQSDEIKKWVSTYSNSVGRTVGDTRSAMTALMNYGMTFDETKKSMDAVAGLAAKTGSSQEEASAIIISALNGRANALRKATGLEMDNYKAQDGSIDRARLMQDIINNTSQAKSMFADSDEAKINRLEGAMAKFKTTIGQGMISILEPLIPLVTSIVNVFSSMPEPLRFVISLITVGFTGLLVLGGPLMSLAGLVDLFVGKTGLLSTVVSYLSGTLSVNTGVQSANASATLGSAMAHSSSATSKQLSSSASAMLTTSLKAENTAENTGRLGKIRSAIATRTKTLSTRANTIATRLNITAIRGHITAMASKIISTVRDTLTTIRNTLSKVANRLSDIASATAEYLVAGAKALVTMVTSLNTTSFIGNTLSTVSNTISKVAQATVTGVTTVATTGLTMAQWALNVAMNANPIGIVIIALVALVAVIYKVGEAFGWWDSFTGMLQSIWNALQGLWNILTSVASAIMNVVTAGGSFNALASIIFGPAYLIYEVLKKIVCIVLGCSPGIIPAFQTLQSVAGGIWNSIASTIGGIVGGIVGVLSGIVSTVASLPQRIWGGLMGIFTRLNQFRILIMQRIQQIALQLLARLTNGLRQLPLRVWQFLSQTLGRLGQFGLQAFIRARNAGLRILNGVLTFVRSIPTRIWSFFSRAIGGILGFAGRAFSSASSVGSRIVSGIINYVKGIPGRIFNEFLNIGNRIKEAGAFVIKKAREFGKSISDTILNVLGIHSPGIIQNKIALEFANIPARIVQQTGNAYRASRSFSEGIIRGFGNPNLNVGGSLQGLNNRLNNQLRNSLNGVVNLNENAPNDSHVTNIYNFQEGAFNNQFDARSFTQDECKRILYNAVDGLQ